MLPLIPLIRPILSAVAPKFLRNLSDGEQGDEFAAKVKAFLDSNVTRIDPSADPATTKTEVGTAIARIQGDPQISERMLGMLIDAEREMNEKRIADIQSARTFRANVSDDTQARQLLHISFVLLLFIIVLVVGLIYLAPRAGTGTENRDLVIQLSGAAIGFLTGIGGMFARNISSAFDFWFGSSAGSRSKSDQIGEILRQTPAPSAQEPVPVPMLVPASTMTPATSTPAAPSPAPLSEVERRLQEFRNGMAEAPTA